MNWEAMVAVVAALGVVSGMVGALAKWGNKLRTHDLLLSIHSRDHLEHYRRESETGVSMARAVAILDQVEGRVGRIETQHDKGRD